MKIILLFIFASIAGITNRCVAQPGFYIPQKARIFFVGDTATIFSNVLNAGTLGMGKGAVLNFKGKIWENEPLSLITDESNNGQGVTGTGGLVRFLSTDSLTQFLTGGYNAASKQGPAFSNLQVQNPYGIKLLNGTTKIRQQLLLQQGLVFLEDNMLVIGNNNPGTITGYDASRYIVTGNAPGKGLLIRENIRSTDGMVVFPLGSNVNAYTPAAIRSHTTRGDDFYATVFDSVKANLFSGEDESENSVNKTWQLGKLLHPGEDEVEIYLQHLVMNEGDTFNRYRATAYISQYAANSWDEGTPQTIPGSGMLTTGSILPNSGLNSRRFQNTLTTASYFTKLVNKNNPTKVWLSAYRTDYLHVRVYWSTKPEINNNYFVVQRRFSNQTDFSNIDTVPSKAINGYSLNYLHYSMMDDNGYNGLTYYRLMLISYNGDTTYSNIVVVGYTPGGNQILIWPNPSPGRVFIGISNAAAVKTIFIWNALGQKIRVEAVRERTIIEMHLYLPGTYFVGFVSYGGQLLETKKLVVTGY